MKLKDLTEYFQENLYEMSNFSYRNTGLPSGADLWLRTEPGALPHVKYRIKIDHPQKGSAVFAIWGNEAKQVEGSWKVTGEDLKKIQTLVYLTRADLIKHIDGEIDSGEIGQILLNAKTKVEQA